MKRFILFLILNFAGLALGAWSTRTGVASDWYQTLEKAPWTPPGWVFGAAWTLIMVCFSAALARLTDGINGKLAVFGVYVLFVIAWGLNVIWNPVFFSYHAVGLGLAVIFILAVVVAMLFFVTLRREKLWALFVLPYFVWIVIATSLNAYIWMMN